MADRSNRKRLCAIPTDISVNSLGRNITFRARRQGYKFFVQGFIHDICFDEPCTEEVVVRARCYRSMRKNAKPHRLIVNLHRDSGQSMYSHCSCTAGLSGKCSHVVGLVQALMHYQEWGMKEVPADMSCTQLQQLWGRPREAKIQPESVLTVAVTKPVEGGHRCRKRKPVKHVSLSDRVQPVTTDSIQALVSCRNTPLAQLLTPECPLVETAVGHVQVGSSFPYQLKPEVQVLQHNRSVILVFRCYSVLMLLLQKVEKHQRPHGHIVHPRGETVPVKAVCTLPEQFKDCNIAIPVTLQEAKELEGKTVQQAECELWHCTRKNRITASNFYKVVKRRKDFNERFITDVMTPKKFTSIPTSYGTAHESVAKEMYAQKNPLIHVHDCGFVVNPVYSFLGATPDGKVCCDGVTGILEIKCPYSARDLTIREAVDQVRDFCLSDRDGNMQLKMDHNYMCQIQGQLMVTGAPFCQFVVYTRVDMHIEQILPNKEFQDNMLFKLSEFYKTYALPYLKKQTV